MQIKRIFLPILSRKLAVTKIIPLNFRSYKRQMEQQKENQQNSIENEIIETGENT